MTHAELIENITAWPDLVGEEDLEAKAASMITLAEAAFQRHLRLAEQLTTTVAYVNENIANLPADCLQVEAVLDSAGVPLRPVAHDQAHEVMSSEAGTWCAPSVGYYAIDGRRLIVPEVTTTVTLRYYQAIPSLSIGSNWLSTKAPDLYLYGALVQAAVFSKEAEQEHARYEAQYARILGELIMADADARYPRAQALRARRRA